MFQPRISNTFGKVAGQSIISRNRSSRPNKSNTLNNRILAEPPVFLSIAITSSNAASRLAVISCGNVSLRTRKPSRVNASSSATVRRCRFHSCFTGGSVAEGTEREEVTREPYHIVYEGPIETHRADNPIQIADLLYHPSPYQLPPALSYV